MIGRFFKRMGRRLRDVALGSPEIPDRRRFHARTVSILCLAAVLLYVVGVVLWQAGLTEKGREAMRVSWQAARSGTLAAMGGGNSWMWASRASPIDVERVAPRRPAHGMRLAGYDVLAVHDGVTASSVMTMLEPRAGESAPTMVSFLWNLWSVLLLEDEGGVRVVDLDLPPGSPVLPGQPRADGSVPNVRQENWNLWAVRVNGEPLLVASPESAGNPVLALAWSLSGELLWQVRNENARPLAMPYGAPPPDVLRRDRDGRLVLMVLRNVEKPNADEDPRPRHNALLGIDVATGTLRWHAALPYGFPANPQSAMVLLAPPDSKDLYDVLLTELGVYWLGVERGNTIDFAEIAVADLPPSDQLPGELAHAIRHHITNRDEHVQQYGFAVDGPPMLPEEPEPEHPDAQLIQIAARDAASPQSLVPVLYDYTIRYGSSADLLSNRRSWDDAYFLVDGHGRVLGEVATSRSPSTFRVSSRTDEAVEALGWERPPARVYASLMTYSVRVGQEALELSDSPTTMTATAAASIAGHFFWGGATKVAVWRSGDDFYIGSCVTRGHLSSTHVLMRVRLEPAEVRP